LAAVAFFLPGRTKDLSALLVYYISRVIDSLAEARPLVSLDHTFLRIVQVYDSLLAIVAGKNSPFRRSCFLYEDLIVVLEVMSTKKVFSGD
jgi:hypothetical protein